MRYEFHAYHGDGSGEIAPVADVTTHEYEDLGAAKAYAGRLSIRIRGPVDLAREGWQLWADRYITTAQPSQHHASGYQLEKLT